MSRDGKSRIPEILKKHEADLLAEWVKEQLGSWAPGSGRVSQAELRDRAWVLRMPAVNATLNGTSALVLFASWLAIRRRQVRAHVVGMISALVLSGAFLAIARSVPNDTGGRASRELEISPSGQRPGSSSKTATAVHAGSMRLAPGAAVTGWVVSTKSCPSHLERAAIATENENGLYPNGRAAIRLLSSSRRSVQSAGPAKATCRKPATPLHGNSRAVATRGGSLASPAEFCIRYEP